MDPVAPRTDDRQIVERPVHRLDGRLPDEQAGLRESAAATQGSDGSREPVRSARALDGDVDAEPAGLLVENRGDIEGEWVEHGCDIQRLRSRPPRRVRLRYVHG